ncbi:site-2 protease family protein [Chitinophaga vietnamensis]|uniref:site-2 protease family protein n=1 Tax=Chitinophaga vietnamensis TaxID=2593957 RepID=UPI00117857D3|nr:site-2 protease family protein [Chitinophaga vietnamensis]
MKNAVTLFRVRKIDISIHWSFPLIIAWIMLIMALQRESLASTLWALLGVVAVFSCVILHELGHALTAASYGIRTKRILLLPIGGMASMERIPEHPVEEIKISAAGPLVNVIIAGALLPFIADYIPFWKYQDAFTNLNGNNFLLYLHTVNILLAIFNLIPAFPMDGGRILRGILALYNNYTRATSMAVLTGRIIAVLFIIAGLLSFNLLLPVIGLFIMVSGKAEETVTYLRHRATGLLIRDVMTTDFVTLPGGLLLQTAAKVLLRNADPYFVIVDDTAAPNIVTRHDVFQAIAKGHKRDALRNLPANNKTILQADMPMTDVVDQLATNPAQAFAVLTDNRLSGIITINNLAEYALVHEQAANAIAGRHSLSWLNLLLALLLCPQALPAQRTADSLRNIQVWDHLLHHRPDSKWPLPSAVPLPGSLLPYKRIVAFYGNFYSPQMGILGALAPDSMLSRLQQEAQQWQAADPMLPVQPAIHYIAVTAQKTGSKYRAQMPPAQIDKALELAARAHAIVFLDVQVGLSTLQDELPHLEKYLAMQQVHLGIDPEYSMKNQQVPCTCIGAYDAADVNYAINYLAELVRQYHLPPKILVVHRFTQDMVTNYKNIRPLPEVQVVMNMDGFGGPALKRDSYNAWIAGQPVQYTGFKLFYGNDVSIGKHLMTPAEVLQLFPAPVYIQYQ